MYYPKQIRKGKTHIQLDAMAHFTNLITILQIKFNFSIYMAIYNLEENCPYLKITLQQDMEN